MFKLSSILKVVLATSLVAASSTGFAYNSGSTGADGAFNPTTTQSIQLPPDGIFNFTTVNIPSGVIITFIKNAANTPVTILATDDVTIAGTINVNASQPTNPSDPGLGGPGGYNGGRGGQPGGITSGWVTGYAGINIGRAGVGPGGGGPGSIHKPGTCYSGSYSDALGGGGGAYGNAPATSACYGTPGAAYGGPTLIPLIGGSGGGGGTGGPLLPGAGGGGGGGAIVIASSTIINVTGAILANGGTSPSLGAYSSSNSRGAYGGGGSGGAIRLIASTVAGNGTISAVGGWGVSDNTNSVSTYGYYFMSTSSNGGAGRIRIEAENLARTAASTPAWVGAAPSLVFVPGLPTLKIDSIGAQAVPAEPTGSGDVALPTDFTNPVTVTFITSGVTVGSSIKLTVIPAQGLAYSATSAPTTGTTDNATASVPVTLNPGPNTLQASVTYTVVASVGDAMSVYAQGERVEKVTLASTLGSQESQVTLTTVSGKEYAVPSSVLALAVLQS